MLHVNSVKQYFKRHLQGGFELGISGMTAATVSHIYNGHDNCSINKPWIDCKAVSNANPVRFNQPIYLHILFTNRKCYANILIMRLNTNMLCVITLCLLHAVSQSPRSHLLDTILRSNSNPTQFQSNCTLNIFINYNKLNYTQLGNETQFY